MKIVLLSIYRHIGSIVAQQIVFTSTSSFKAAIVEFKEEKLFPAKLGEAFLPRPIFI